ncbi:MAG TPA: transcription antitermination factor NusB, partial [Candidatus Polarisedimenticolia bacterium]|nr:transcription antitermination factor NusB [Candidatus Polarisedimenticolia bacterium]
MALEILRRVEREGAYSSLLLQRLDEIQPGRDVSLVTELVYGTIRRARYLDDVIAAYSSRPVASIEPDLRL